MKRGEASRPRRTQRAPRTTASKPAAQAAKPSKRTKTISRTCSRCGAMASCPEGGMPAAWTMSVERRGVEFLCSACSRANIRAIEGKLPEEYWE